MIRCAVIGNPVSHSLSPQIHQEFARQAGIQLVYEKIFCALPHFEWTIKRFFEQGARGLNVTLPFKERAFALASHATSRCQQAGAANTLWMQDNRLHADNTDGAGLLRDLEKYIGIKGKKVLLAGAGGAARGVIGPLLAKQPLFLTLVNRNHEKAKDVQTDFPDIRCERLEKLKAEYDIIINATSAGLTDGRFFLAEDMYARAQFCYDLNYDRHKTTVFVQQALDAGAQAADGLGMLVEQAAEAFEIWHGFKPDTRGLVARLKQSSEFTDRSL